MHRNFAGPRRQEGVVLMIALIVLVAMTLAGLGMIRAIDTGTMVAGNIGFRESAVATGDSGIEAARTWLMANINSLDTDQASSGYYSTRQDNLDFTGNMTAGGTDGVNWDGSDSSQPVTAFDAGTTLDSTGNHVYYLIQRMCSIPGSINAPAQSCTTVSQSGIGSTQNAPDYSSYGLATKNEVYYRITSRVNGPKNTVSYVQAVILL
jgi:Tfp pilus assembly protein PilX